MISLYVKNSFLDAYEATDGIYKARTLRTLAEFMYGILLPSKNMEKLPQYSPAFYTLRVSGKYRVLITKRDSENYDLLYMGGHDEVYDWCKKNKKNRKILEQQDCKRLEEIFPDLNEYLTDALIPEIPDDDDTEDESWKNPEGVFRQYSDKELLLGLQSEEELETVRGWVTSDDCSEGVEKLSPRSKEFILTLLKTGKIDDAVHSLHIIDGHEETDKRISDIISDIKEYGKPNKMTFYAVGAENFRDDACFYIAGLGGRKTAELLDIGIRHDDNTPKTSVRKKAAFIISNPVCYEETLSFIKICHGGIPDYLEVMTFDDMYARLLKECSSRWKLSFRIEELAPGNEIFDIFSLCVEEVMERFAEIEPDMVLFTDEWNTVIEENGLYTPLEYWNHPRVGAAKMSFFEKTEIAEILPEFVQHMKNSCIYTPGFALKKFSGLCKKKGFHPFDSILVDDYHYLTPLQQEFIFHLTGNNPFRANVEENYVIGNPCFVRSLFNECFEIGGVGTLYSSRTNGEKKKWLKKINWLLYTKNFDDVFSGEVYRCKPDSEDTEKNLIGVPFDGSYMDKEKCIAAIRKIYAQLEHPEQTALVVTNDDEAKSVCFALENANIPYFRMTEHHTVADSLLEPGIRVCTLLDLGCKVFRNIIIYRPEITALTDLSEVPQKSRLRSEKDQIASRLYLLERAVCASLDKTWYLESRDEKNLISCVEEGD